MDEQAILEQFPSRPLEPSLSRRFFLALVLVALAMLLGGALVIWRYRAGFRGDVMWAGPLIFLGSMLLILLTQTVREIIQRGALVGPRATFVEVIDHGIVHWARGARNYKVRYVDPEGRVRASYSPAPPFFILNEERRLRALAWRLSKRSWMILDWNLQTLQLTPTERQAIQLAAAAYHMDPSTA